MNKDSIAEAITALWTQQGRLPIPVEYGKDTYMCGSVVYYDEKFAFYTREGDTGFYSFDDAILHINILIPELWPHLSESERITVMATVLGSHE